MLEAERDPLFTLRCRVWINSKGGLFKLKEAKLSLASCLESLEF